MITIDQLIQLIICITYKLTCLNNKKQRCMELLMSTEHVSFKTYAIPVNQGCRPPRPASRAPSIASHRTIASTSKQHQQTTQKENAIVIRTAQHHTSSRKPTSASVRLTPFESPQLLRVLLPKGSTSEATFFASSMVNESFGEGMVFLLAG